MNMVYKFKKNKKWRSSKQWGYSLAPTMFTVSALAAGIHALRFVFIGDYIKAGFCILLAGFLDAIDGKVARFLQVSSKFGGTLDTIADFLNFGVVPAFLLYFKYLDSPKLSIGWVAVIFYISCTAWRLARFSSNGMQGEFFEGVPAPGGAFLVLMPLCFESAFFQVPNIKYITIFFLIICGILMVSTIKALAISRIKLPRRFLGLFLCFLCASFGLFFIHTFEMIFFMQILYLFSFCLSFKKGA